MRQNGEKMRSVIYVMAHKKFACPREEIYVPLQVGAANCPSLGYQKDNEGDSISERNGSFCELTGIYWVWKNDCTNDIVGISHYRRFFFINNALLQKNEIEKILSCHDMIVTQKLESGILTVKENYEAVLKNSIDLEETRNSILKLFPEYVDSFDNVMNGHEQYFANMFVCKKNIFDNYASWLFTILFDVEEKLDLSDRDSYCRRVFGFIAERLLMVWVRFNNLKVYEMQVNEIGEKIEVTEAVNKLVSLKKEKRITEAMELITKIKKNYPQMFASISDTEGRLREVATHISQEYYEKKRTILETQEVNNKGIVIIIATNNETYMSECMSYISNLIVPEGFELSVL